MRDAFIVRKGNPKNLHTYEDIAEKGAKLATGIGYAEIDYAEGRRHQGERHHDPAGPAGRLLDGRAAAAPTSSRAPR